MLKMKEQKSWGWEGDVIATSVIIVVVVFILLVCAFSGSFSRMSDKYTDVKFKIAGVTLFLFLLILGMIACAPFQGEFILKGPLGLLAPFIFIFFIIIFALAEVAAL